MTLSYTIAKRLLIADFYMLYSNNILCKAFLNQGYDISSPNIRSGSLKSTFITLQINRW